MYLDGFKHGMMRGENRWYYEGFAASWDDVNALAKLKVLTVAPPGYVQRVHLANSLRQYMSKWRACAQAPMVRTGCGLCFLQKWAPLRYSSTTALLMAIYTEVFHEDPMAASLREWALSQLHYVLGENGLGGRSFMIGYRGVDGSLLYPRRPHHRAASCPASSADHRASCNASQLCEACGSPWILYGAVVGGPDETDCWSDDRVNWERNEVALDYNAPTRGSSHGRGT